VAINRLRDLKKGYLWEKNASTMTDTRMDRTQIRVYKKGEEPNDLLYWLSVPPMERIRALEQIRKEYNDWKYGPERGFQRVYRVVKREWS